MKKPATVNSLNKAIDLIEDLCERGPSSLADLNIRLSLDKATMYRLLNTLRQRGYVEQSIMDHRYFMTKKMFQLTSQEMDRGGLNDLVRPYMKKIAATFKEDTHMSLMPEPGKAICIDKVDSTHSQYMRVKMNLGSEVLVHASSMGKALLAFANPAVREEALSRIGYERLTPHTITTAAALRKELKRVRKQGYSIDDGETLESVYCVGVPILDRQAEAVAAVSVTGHKSRMLEKRDSIIRMLMECSREVSILCGLPPEQWPFKTAEQTA